MSTVFHWINWPVHVWIRFVPLIVLHIRYKLINLKFRFLQSYLCFFTLFCILLLHTFHIFLLVFLIRFIILNCFHTLKTVTLLSFWCIFLIKIARWVMRQSVDYIIVYLVRILHILIVMLPAGITFSNLGCCILFFLQWRLCPV